jgi:hypothetical protein
MARFHKAVMWFGVATTVLRQEIWKARMAVEHSAAVTTWGPVIIDHG